MATTMSNDPPTPPTGLPNMEYRFLGRSGLKVSALSFGGWLTSGEKDREQTFACMAAAYACGVNFFDTAEVYSSGESETVMGEAIRHYGWRRCDLVISTKIYWGAGANSQSRAHSVNCVGLSRKHIVEGLRASLGRLGLEYVDLVYAHRPDKDTPMEETVRAFNWVIEKGWAFYWGTSEWSAEEIQDAWRVADKLGLIGPLMEQPQYNLLSRDKVEREFLPLYEKHSLGLTIFSPLKAGFLTGKYDSLTIPNSSRLDTSSTDKYISTVVAKFQARDPEMMRNVEVAKALKPITDKLGCTRSQLALAWVLKNGNVSSAITGATRVEQVWENVRALEVVPRLTAEVMREIEEAAGTRPVAEVRRF